MLQRPSVNTLVLADFEDTCALALKDAVYCILPDGRFSLSIESEADALMGEAVFTFERVAIPGELAAGATLSVPYPQGERESFDEASTHLYFGAHDDPRDCVLEVVSVAAGSIVVVARFLWHEDYDPDAGRMRHAEGAFHAECRLGTIDELKILM